MWLPPAPQSDMRKDLTPGGTRKEVAEHATSKTTDAVALRTSVMAGVSVVVVLDEAVRVVVGVQEGVGVGERE